MTVVTANRKALSPTIKELRGVKLPESLDGESSDCANEKSISSRRVTL